MPQAAWHGCPGPREAALPPQGAKVLCLRGSQLPGSAEPALSGDPGLGLVGWWAGGRAGTGLVNPLEWAALAPEGGKSHSQGRSTAAHGSHGTPRPQAGLSWTAPRREGMPSPTLRRKPTLPQGASFSFHCVPVAPGGWGAGGRPAALSSPLLPTHRACP